MPCLSTVAADNGVFLIRIRIVCNFWAILFATHDELFLFWWGFGPGRLGEEVVDPLHLGGEEGGNKVVGSDVKYRYIALGGWLKGR